MSLASAKALANTRIRCAARIVGVRYAAENWTKERIVVEREKPRIT
jgi:hypothetical protein